MSDCPEKLTTGASLIVTLHAYILESAFTPPTISRPDEKPVVFNEGLETVDEKYILLASEHEYCQTVLFKFQDAS